MKKLTILLLSLFILSSCELYYEENTYSINLISIGIDYKNTTYSSNWLEGTINDAKEFEKALTQMCDVNDITINSSGYYQVGNSYSSDTIEDSLYPSKEHILSAFETLESSADENSINIIYYSGHGDSDGSLILATTDTETGAISFDEDGNVTSDQKLTVSEVYEAIDDIPGKTVIIADSCYSGSFFQDSVYSESEDDFSFTSAFENLFSDDSEESEYSDIFIISASQDDEYSSEYGYTRYHGYFTKALLEGMGWCDGEKGFLSYFKIPEMIDEDDGIQGELADGDPPATSSGILSLDSLVSYVDENIDERATQTAQVSAWRYDLVLFEY
jgi:hypothetical protein